MGVPEYELFAMPIYPYHQLRVLPLHHHERRYTRHWQSAKSTRHPPSPALPFGFGATNVTPSDSNKAR